MQGFTIRVADKTLLQKWPSEKEEVCSLRCTEICCSAYSFISIIAHVCICLRFPVAVYFMFLSSVSDWKAVFFFKLDL